MPEYSHKFFILAFVYLITVVIGSSFVFNATFLSFLPDFWLISLIVFIPLPFFALYHYHSRFPSLWQRQRLLRNIAIILMIISIIFVAVFIAPVVLLLA